LAIGFIGDGLDSRFGVGSQLSNETNGTRVYGLTSVVRSPWSRIRSPKPPRLFQQDLHDGAAPQLLRPVVELAQMVNPRLDEAARAAIPHRREFRLHVLQQ
jgi:hypothetical protein